jgi:hypothetical protein
LRALHDIDGVEARAFADDLALSTDSIAALSPAMVEIDEFKVASGLTKNVKKTKVLCANNRAQAEAELANSPWPDISTTISNTNT